MTESELEIVVKRAQSGDRAAAETLLGAYRQPVFALALTFLKNRQLAEEAAQEAFLKIFFRIPTLKKPKKFRTWCLTITANHCRDMLRSRRPQTVSLEAAQELSAPEAESELSERLRQAISHLKPDLRQALVLRDVECFSYQEISEIQKTALGTVKSRIFEARRKLRKWLTPCDVSK